MLLVRYSQHNKSRQGKKKSEILFKYLFFIYVEEWWVSFAGDWAEVKEPSWFHSFDVLLPEKSALLIHSDYIAKFYCTSVSVKIIKALRKDPEKQRLEKVSQGLFLSMNTQLLSEKHFRALRFTQ